MYYRHEPTRKLKVIHANENIVIESRRISDNLLIWRHTFNVVKKDWTTEVNGNVGKAHLGYSNAYICYGYDDETPEYYEADMVQSMEEQILKDRRKAKEQRVYDEAAARFKTLKPLSDACVNFGKDKFPSYLIYNKKKHTCYCTHCESDVDITKAVLNHNKEAICPNCKREGTAKADGYSSTVADVYTLVVPAKVNGELVFRYFTFRKNYFKGWRVSEYRIHESIREVFGKKHIFYECMTNGIWTKCHTAVKNSYYYSAGDVIFHYGCVYSGCFYDRNLKQIFKGTRYEHCGFELFLKYNTRRNPWKYKRYLRCHDDSNIFEYLYKVGFVTIANKIFDQYYHYGSLGFDIDRQGKTLPQMLCITKQQYKLLLAKGNPSEDDLVKCQLMNKYGIKTDADYDIYREYIHNRCNKSWFFECYKFSWHKLDKYMRRWQRNKSVDIYIDYLHTASLLGWDLKSDFVAFPKHLKAKHDSTVELYNIQKDALAVEKARKENVNYLSFVDTYREKYMYENKQMTILVPNDCGEVALEGQKLRHCVGTYVSKVNKGESIILFIRKKDKTDVPFFTLEIVNGYVTQCYGYKDRNTTPEVEEFLQGFVKEKQLTCRERKGA